MKLKVMKLIFLLAIFLITTSCISPVKSEHFWFCIEACSPSRVDSVADHPFKGRCCKCDNGKVIWMDKESEQDEDLY